MENDKLINYNYFAGKRFNELSPLEKVILRVLKFDWVMRPTKPDSRDEFKFVWRFGEDGVGYYLEADMEETQDAYKLIHSKRIDARDVLEKLTSPFRICTDDPRDDNIVFGEYKE